MLQTRFGRLIRRRAPCRAAASENAILLSFLLVFVSGLLWASTALPAPSPAPATGPSSTRSLPAGTILYVRLATPLSSLSSKAGEAVKLRVARQVFDGGRVAVPVGSIIDAKVQKVVKSSDPNTPALMLLQFSHLILPGMPPLPIDCHLLKIENARETILADGSILGVKANQLPSSYLDTALGDLSKSLPSLSSAITGIQKKQVGAPDTAISYPRGTDMQLVLDKPLAVPKFFAAAVPLQLPAAFQGSIRTLLNQMPKRSSTQKGTPGDPINLILVGSEAQIQKTFLKAGWIVPAARQTNSILKTVQSVIQGQGYGSAPISNLYLYGHPQEIAFEKMLNTFSMRHHIRLWLSPLKGPSGTQIWLGAAVHDTGYDVRGRSHATSPDLDAERAKVGADLLDTGLVAAEQLVMPPRPLSKGFTGTGGAWHTDGRLLAIQLKP